MSTTGVSVGDLSVEDIFNSDLITDQLGQFLHYDDRDHILTVVPELTCSNSTDLSTAMEAMRFHRHMMNEYLLSDYLSREILGYVPAVANISEKIEKRSGKAKNNSYTETADKNALPTNHKLIEDEGSSQYTTWLKRMNTYQDIQQHLLNKRRPNSEKLKTSGANRRQSLSFNLDPNYAEADTGDELDYMEDGDVTGYAFTGSPTEPTMPMDVYRNHQKSMKEGKSSNLKKQAVNKVGYENGYDDYTAPPHPVENYDSTNPSKQSKEIGLKDISDIALTTLAFLSFGMFILQVLMCITMTKDDTSTMVMLPMESDNSEIPGDGNIEEIRRKRRSILPVRIQNIEMIDHLAKRALVSLNAVTSISKDGGVCHHYSLCENNKFSRRLGDIKRLWIPAWSLGISWLSMKFNESQTKTSIKNENRIINSLKAIVVGLNNGNCATMYVKKCNLIFN